MIDRIEELLAVPAAENEDEEQEDVPTLTATGEAVPVSPCGGWWETGDGGTEKRGEAVSEGAWSGARASAGPRSGPETSPSRSESDRAPSPLCSVTTGEIVPGRPGLIAGEAGSGGTEDDRSGRRTAGEILLEQPGLMAGETAVKRAEAAGELWKDGPLWTVRSAEPDIDRAQRAAAAERTVQMVEGSLPPQDERPIWSGLEPAARGGSLGTELENVRRFGAAWAGLEQAGLKGLYRQTVQGLRPAAPTLPTEQAGRAVRTQEPGSAASLAVDELDRAVRRDSRRYDGGMSIY